MYQEQTPSMALEDVQEEAFGSIQQRYIDEQAQWYSPHDGEHLFTDLGVFMGQNEADQDRLLTFMDDIPDRTLNLRIGDYANVAVAAPQESALAAICRTTVLEYAELMRETERTNPTTEPYPLFHGPHAAVFDAFRTLDDAPKAYEYLRQAYEGQPDIAPDEVLFRVEASLIGLARQLETTEGVLAYKSICAFYTKLHEQSGSKRPFSPHIIDDTEIARLQAYAAAHRNHVDLRKEIKPRSDWEASRNQTIKEMLLAFQGKNAMGWDDPRMLSTVPTLTKRLFIYRDWERAEQALGYLRQNDFESAFTMIHDGLLHAQTASHIASLAIGKAQLTQADPEVAHVYRKRLRRSWYADTAYGY